MLSRKELIAGLFCLIAATTWGLNFHLIKIMLKESAPLEAGMWRYLFAVIPLGVLALKGIPDKATFRKNLVPMLIIGGAGLFVFNFLLFVGVSYTSAVNAGLIAALTPALTLVLSAWILKTPIIPRQVFGVTIALLGAIYLISKGDFTTLAKLSFSFGDILMVLASIMFALHNVWVKKYGGGMANRQLTFYTNLVCFLGFLLIFWVQPVGDFTTYSSQYWLATLGIGVLGTAVAYFLFNLGIAVIGAPRAGIFLNAVPLSAAFFAIFFGEPLFSYHLISAVIIIAGLVILQIR